jgi:hypothetical protein
MQPSSYDMTRGLSQWHQCVYRHSHAPCNQQPVHLQWQQNSKTAHLLTCRLRVQCCQAV